ncbi:hypothetical protein SLEP1_g29302 [Rubroshorea leprosula]|uniref:Reverse transcriptase Ty1/copia-type domain-containing protein n=1 Tax=Rubroshorea leprosula TaxID=152421 RepID=A0AAV5JZ06_9ROSI|nr:hypothetical protein SLEP1_g29302 [Rubroshorea leprosula]
MREEETEDNNEENNEDIELEGDENQEFERDNISAQSTLGPNNQDSPSSSINPLSTIGINPSLVQVAQEEPYSAKSSQEPITVQVAQEECMDIRELTTIKKVLQLPQWLRAMQEELDAFYKNNTWTVVPPPLANTNIVGSKWVFKTKLNPDVSVDRCKARLVARGFSQVPGVEFEETFSPVLKPTILCQADSFLFVFHNGQDTTLLLLYVDDIVLITSSSSLLQHIIENLNSKFALKDLGFLSYFLGIEITLFLGGIFLSQAKYAKDILTRATMLEASMIATPMAVKEPHIPRDEEPIDAQEYRKIVGAL